MWKRCLAGALVAASVAGAATESATLETGANSAFAYVQKDWPARGLTAGELEEALEEWDGDRAVLLYASWCRYCRQFKPIWHAVNKFFQANGAKNIEVVTFDCEKDVSHQRLCASVGVRHYPSVLFVGHGSYHASDPVSVKLLGAAAVPDRTVMYKGDLYYEAVRDWCRTMRFLSRMSRWSSKLGRLLGRSSSRQGSGTAASSSLSKVDKLTAENQALKAAAQASALATTAAAAKAAEQSKLATKYGTSLDPFEVLAGVNYGVANATHPEAANAETPVLASVKRCLVEVVAQYCEGRGPEAAEPYCSKVVPCWKSGFADKSCRPPQCPLHEPGCAFASICLNSEVLEQFAPKGASNTAASTVAGNGASAGSSSSGETVASTMPEAAEAGGFAAAARAKAAQTARAAAATTVEKGTTASGGVELEVMPEENGGEGTGGASETSAGGQANGFQLTEDEEAQVQQVLDEEVIDPAVLAAARAASAAATGIGGGGSVGAPGGNGDGAMGGSGGGGRSGRGPRRRSLWDPDAAAAAESETPPAAEVDVGAIASEVPS